MLAAAVAAQHGSATGQQLGFCSASACGCLLLRSCAAGSVPCAHCTHCTHTILPLHALHVFLYQEESVQQHMTVLLLRGGGVVVSDIVCTTLRRGRRLAKSAWATGCPS